MTHYSGYSAASIRQRKPRRRSTCCSSAGSENLNIDLMFGLPGQTLAQWETTLERAIALGPSHISTYCLTYEEDTEFLRRHTEGEFRSDPEADADFFNLADESLGGAGFEASRNFELCAAWLSIGPQPGLLERARLPWARAELACLDDRVAPRCRIFGLPCLHRSRAGRSAGCDRRRKADTRDEAHGGDRVIVADQSRDSRGLGEGPTG